MRWMKIIKRGTLNDVPEDERNDVMLCKYAITCFYFNWKWVPDNIKPILSDWAYDQDYRVFMLFDTCYKTYDMCLDIIENKHKYLYECIPECYMNNTICNKLLDALPNNIIYIPEDQRTYQRYTRLIPVITNPMSVIASVPTPVWNQNLADLFIQYHNSYIKYIPRIWLNRENCRSGITHLNIDDVPAEYLTHQDCVYYNRLDLSTRRVTVSECIKCIKDGGSLGHIPKYAYTQELCNLAVEINADNINYVPKLYQTRDMWEKVVKEYYFFLNAVPAEFKSYSIYRHAYRYDIKALGAIPIKYRLPIILTTLTKVNNH